MSLFVPDTRTQTKTITGSDSAFTALTGSHEGYDPSVRHSGWFDSPWQSYPASSAISNVGRVEPYTYGSYDMAASVN